MQDYTAIEKEVLTQLQRGVEPVARPFKGLALPERDVVELLNRASDDGYLRRFGIIYDARRLGYKSMLCALDCAEDRRDQKANIIANYPGVTHCYERQPLINDTPYPTLWFTFAMLHEQFAVGLDEIRSQIEDENSKLLQLPALRRFKIDVIFDLQKAKREERFPGAPAATDEDQTEEFRTFSAQERDLVRATDQQIPLVATPFAEVAKQVGQSEEMILDTLRVWKQEGIVRRIAVVLNHRKSGFKANGMCVWPVEADIASAGRGVASRPEVTHCYQRPRRKEFPFDLYAMIHTPSWSQTKALFRDISSQCDLPNGELFASLREYKKTSMQYFR